MTRDKVVEKFQERAGMVLKRDRVEEARRIVEHLEELKDSAALAAVVTV